MREVPKQMTSPVDGSKDNKSSHVDNEVQKDNLAGDQLTDKRASAPVSTEIDPDEIVNTDSEDSGS